jgi:hypothetical protein
MKNTSYEFFIRRAWKCNRFPKGANTNTWESLLYKKYNCEQAVGKANEHMLKVEYESKFYQVKNNIDNAYNNLLYQINNNDVLVNTLIDLKTSVVNSAKSQELYDVLINSIQILNDNGL